jgi:hypothetical protein
MHVGAGVIWGLLVLSLTILLVRLTPFDTSS